MQKIKIAFYSVFLLIISITNLLADSVAFQPLPENDPVAVTKTANGLNVNISIPAVEWVSADQDGEIPLIEGAAQESTPGGPILPVFSRLVAVPEGMELLFDDYNVTWNQCEEHTFATDLGRENNVQSDENLFTASFEKSQQTVVVHPTYRWRDILVAKVDIRPMRVDPLSKNIEVAHEIDASFSFSPSNKADSYNPKGVSEAMLPLYQTYVTNVLDEIDPSEVTRGTYLFIISSDGGTDWLDALEDLIAWRTRTGYTVHVATTTQTGTTFNSVDAFIEEFYEACDPPLDYVALVGDTDSPCNMPTYLIDMSDRGDFIDQWIATDQMYTYDQSLGNDYGNVLPKFFIGRLSVDTEQDLRSLVNKTIAYERDPDEGNTARWTRAAVIADASVAISTAQTVQWVAGKLEDNGFNQIDVMIHQDFNNIPSSELVNAINSGLSWVGYRGFGGYQYWTGSHFQWFSQFEINQLQNEDDYPIITSMVCGGGGFDEVTRDPCFGEMWTRLGTANHPKGAVAFVGPSEIDTHTRWNNMILGGWYTALLDQKMSTLGQCMISSKMQLENNYTNMWNSDGGSSNSVWFYFHTYNILGDAALKVRTGLPISISVNHPSDILENSSYIPVSVTTSSNMPIEGAYVVFTENETTIIGAGYTNANGDINIHIENDVINESEIEITVTKNNITPYLNTIVVENASGTTLTSISTTEDDSDAGTNGNGNLNPGELVIPSPSFEIVENGGIDNLIISVALIEGGGEVITSNQQFGNVNQSSTVTPSDFRIRLDEMLTDGQRIPVIFTLQGANFSQSHHSYLSPVEAPVLSIDDLDWSTAPTPGGTSILSLSLLNGSSSLDISGLTAILESSDDEIEITDANGSWNSITTGSSVNCNDSFVITISDDTYPGHTVSAVLHLTSDDGDQVEVDLNFDVAGDLETAPTGPVGPGYYFYEDIDEGFEYAPDFQFTSIHSHPNASNLQLDDYGDNGDITTTISLPFMFPYWDDTFSQISVCSNGWFSFGETDLFFFRNRPLPGPLTPTGAVCVFWDDLIIHWNDSDVYTFYDQDNNWFVIEWYNVSSFSNQNVDMTFQAIILDPEFHGAPGGVGMIALIYDDISNIDSQENFCTIGITNLDASEGMMYEFGTEVNPTTGGIEDGRQILIAAGHDSGLEPGVLDISAPIVHMNAVNNNQGSASISITNSGERSIRYRTIVEGITSGWNDDISLDDSGGPDNGGYLWYDSREFYGPTYQWVDIEETQYEVSLNNGNAQGGASISEEISLPFEFELYGESYSSMWICESGYVTFQEPGSAGSSSNFDLPRTTAPRAAIFPFWDNVGTDEQGEVYAKFDDDIIVVTWNNITHLTFNNNEGPYTFQLILTQSGSIDIQYNEMGLPHNSATIGLQNFNAQIGNTVSVNTSTENYFNAEQDGLALHFSPGAPWLSVAPSSVSVGGGETVVMNLTGDANLVDPGIYSARVLLVSQLSNQKFSIPVHFSVASSFNLGNSPTISTIPGESIANGDEFTPFNLDPYVEDWDNSDSEIEWLVYDTDGLNIEIDDERDVTITQDAEWDGESTVTFRALDDRLNFDEFQAVYKLGEENDPPRFDTASPDAVGIIAPGTETHFSVTTSDPEGDSVTLSWYHGLEFVGNGNSADITLITEAYDTVRVFAQDENSLSSSIFWSGIATTTDVDDDNDNIPTEFSIESIYPNPFNAQVSVGYQLPKAVNVEFRIFNLLGREVARNLIGLQSAGHHLISFDGTAWSSGIYFISWQAGKFNDIRKVVLLK
jgi:Peptidase family C25/Secretion system C-terminal sorting domain